MMVGVREFMASEAESILGEIRRLRGRLDDLEKSMVQHVKTEPEKLIEFYRKEIAHGMFLEVLE